MHQWTSFFCEIYRQKLELSYVTAIFPADISEPKKKVRVGKKLHTKMERAVGVWSSHEGSQNGK
jgi:hypothetical protein